MSITLASYLTCMYRHALSQQSICFKAKSEKREGRGFEARDRVSVSGDAGGYGARGAKQKIGGSKKK